MKQLIIFLLLFPLLSFGQFKELKVPATPWGQYGSQANCVIWTPYEHADSVHKTYPCIIWFHGRGQGGSDVNRIYGDGLLKRIKAGWEPQAADPITGKLEKFIVIAVQWDWSPYPDLMGYAWEYLKKATKLRIDSSRIYTSGLSSGGQCSIMFPSSTPARAQMIAAVVSASPAAIEAYYVPTLPNLAKYKVPIRFYSGEYDAVFTNTAKSIMGIVNKDTVLATLTTFPGGHGPWTPLFDGTVKFPWHGKQLNMYEWLLTNRRGVAPEPPVVTPPADSSSKVIQILHDPAKVQKIIILDKDGTWTEYQDSVIISGPLKMEMR